MKTSDVYLSAALLALGFELVGINRTDPRRMIFDFREPASLSGNLGTFNRIGLADVETTWANKTLVVNAFDFSEAIKRMKSLIHSS